MWIRIGLALGGVNSMIFALSLVADSAPGMGIALFGLLCSLLVAIWGLLETELKAFGDKLAAQQTQHIQPPTPTD